MDMKIEYTLLKTEKNTKARLGKIKTNYGEYETPMFMPVGTQATVKTLAPEELKAIDCGIILANTYHLWLRPGEDIVDKAIEEDAKVIGLSALMTTTMMRMKDVVELCKKKGCNSKVIIGGACITPSFAEEIGADGYSKDAADCVKLVEKLLR